MAAPTSDCQSQKKELEARQRHPCPLPVFLGGEKWPVWAAAREAGERAAVIARLQLALAVLGLSHLEVAVTASGAQRAWPREICRQETRLLEEQQQQQQQQIRRGSAALAE
jgi:hypothetical protein